MKMYILIAVLSTYSPNNNVQYFDASVAGMYDTVAECRQKERFNNENISLANPHTQKFVCLDKK